MTAERMQAAARAAMVGKTIPEALRDSPDVTGARSELLALMQASGSERVRVSGETGADYGTISYTPGKPKVKLVDERRFLDWVRRNHPTEIMVVETVRPAFVDKIQTYAEKVGEPIEEGTGVIIPGIEVVEGDPGLVVRPTAAARTRAREIVAGGVLAIGSAAESGGAAAGT